MALVDGNKTYSNPTPGASSATLAHNQNVGADGALLVVVTMANTVNFSGCTYNGVSMTLVNNAHYSGNSQRQAIYYLSSPATGSNNVVVSFTGNQWNPISFVCISFTGAAATAGAVASNGFSTTPNSQTLTIAANSMIYASGISNNAQSFGYDIAGSTRTNLFTHNSNKIVEGALSATGLSAGSTNVTTKADTGTISNHRVEIQEAGGGGGGRRRIIIC